MMNPIAKREYGVLLFLAILLLGTTIPSLLYARREKRDGARRDALVELKHKLEEANNKIGYYPAQFSAVPYQFVVTDQAGKEARGWYLRTALENNQRSTAGFDFEGNHNFYYRITKAGTHTYYDICGGNNTCGTK